MATASALISCVRARVRFLNARSFEVAYGADTIRGVLDGKLKWGPMNGCEGLRDSNQLNELLREGAWLREGVARQPRTASGTTPDDKCKASTHLSLI